MVRISGWAAMTALTGMLLAGAAAAQSTGSDPVYAAAQKVSKEIAWHETSVLAADFNCTGTVQFAILGTSLQEIVVAMFSPDLTQAPALLRFAADARNRQAAKIRLDDYTMSASEIAGIAGAPPVGYRPSGACHGVRLSDDSSEAAHIYWDHDNRRFDSWAQ